MTLPNQAVWTVVVAAGKGSRMGCDIPKQYLTIAGDSVLMHTLRALAHSGCVAGVMLVLAADDSHWPLLAHVDGMAIRTTTGGATRADSVRAGLQALMTQQLVADDDVVMVHDAARPLLRANDVHALLAAAQSHEHGALLAAPVVDTIKQANDHGYVRETVDRSTLWRALTPQAFRCQRLMQALDFADAEDVTVSDEAMAVEHAGFPVKIVPGAADNLKLTRPEDLPLLTWLLQQRGALNT